MAYTPIGQTPTGMAAPPTFQARVSGAMQAFSANEPSMTGDMNLIVSGGTTLATGYGAYKYSVAKAAVKAAEQTIEPAAAAKLKFGMTSLARAGRNSAIFAGVISTAQNLINTFQGNQTGTRAAGNITADVAGAFGAGMVAAGTAGFLATALSLPAAAVGIVGAGVGAAAYFGLDFLYRSSGAHRGLSDAVTNFLDSLFRRGGGGGPGGM